MLSSQRLLSVVLVIILTAAGCAPRLTPDSVASGRLPELQAPGFSAAVSGTLVSSFDPPGSGARLRVQLPVAIRNPNPFELTVRLSELSFRLGSGSEARPLPEATGWLTVPAGSTAWHTFELSQGLRQDAGLLRQAAAVYAGQRLPVILSGTFHYSSERHPWLTAGQFSVSALAGPDGTVELPELTIVAADSSAYFLPDDSPVVRVIIEAVNPGSIGYLLHAKDLVLQLAGQAIAVHDLPPTPVPAGSSSRVALNFAPVPALLSPAGRTALSDALAGAAAELLIEGQLALDVLGLDTWLLPADQQLRSVIHAD